MSIDEIRQRLKAITKGQWTVNKYGGIGIGALGIDPPLISFDPFGDATKADYEFIAHAPQDIAYLLSLLEWQPIETAPKDGTDVLIYGVDVADEGTACYHMTISSFNNHPLKGNPYWRKMTHPTDWMPLPKPPKGGE